MAALSNLDYRFTQIADEAHRTDATPHCDSPIAFFCSGFHQESFGHGQPLQPATRWADGELPTCICSTLQPHLPSPSITSRSDHIHLDGDSLTLNSPRLTSIATGSLQNKIFPPKKEIWKSLQKALVEWHRKNAIPSLPTRRLEDLWKTSWAQHTHQLRDHITHRDISQFVHLFPGAVFHNEDKRATSLRIYCPCLYFECLQNTFADPQVFKRLEASPDSLIQSMLTKLTQRFEKPYTLGHWAKVEHFPMPMSSQSGRNSSGQAVPSSASTQPFSDPC